MSPSVMTSSANDAAQVAAVASPDWVVRATLLWEYRRMLGRVTAIALVVSLGIAFAIPKRYTAVASIMAWW